MGESSMNNEREIDAAGGNISTDNAARQGTGRSGWLPRILAGVGGLLLMTAVSYVTARIVTPQVVVFDMKGTMDIFIQQSAQQKLDEAGTKKLVTRFSQAMRDSLSGWQSKHNAIILVAPAVVSDQTDITTDIRNDIALRMQEGK